MAHLIVDTESASLMEPSQETGPWLQQRLRSGARPLLAALVASAVLATAAAMLTKADKSIVTASGMHGEKAALRQANLAEASSLWGVVEASTPFECQQRGGFVCSDRPLACCESAEACSSYGQCVEHREHHSRFAGGYAGRAAYGGGATQPYGASPVFYGQPRSRLQRLSDFFRSLNPMPRISQAMSNLKTLNPFRKSAPTMYGSGSSTGQQMGAPTATFPGSNRGSGPIATYGSSIGTRDEALTAAATAQRARAATAQRGKQRFTSGSSYSSTHSSHPSHGFNLFGGGSHFSHTSHSSFHSGHRR